MTKIPLKTVHESLSTDEGNLNHIQKELREVINNEKYMPCRECARTSSGLANTLRELQ